MELDGKAVPFFVLDALAGAVVGVDLGNAAHLGGQLVPHHRVAVVLAGDEGAAAGKVGHGLVGAAVAVLQLGGLGAGGQGRQLVAQADAEGGHAQRKDPAQVLNGFHRLGGVAGAVGQHDAVRVQGGHLFGGGEGGHHRHLAAAAGQAADDVPLAAVVHQDDVGRAGGVVHLGLLAGDGGHRAGDGVGFYLRQQGLGALFVGGVGGVEFGQDGAVHDAALPDDPGQVPGVDALDADDVVFLQKAVQRLLRAPVGRGLAGFPDDVAPGPYLARLHIPVVHAVVADQGVSLGDDLAVVAGVGQGLLKAHHAGSKDHLAHRDARSAHRLARKNHPVCQKKICVHCVPSFTLAQVSQGLLGLLAHLAAAQVHQGQLALLAQGALLGGVVGQVQLEGAGQDGDGRRGLGLGAVHHAGDAQADAAGLLDGPPGLQRGDAGGDHVLGDDALLTRVDDEPLEGHHIVHPLGEDGPQAGLAGQLVGVDDAAHGRPDDDVGSQLLDLGGHGGHHLSAPVGVLLQEGHLAVGAGMAARRKQEMPFQECVTALQNLDRFTHNVSPLTISTARKNVLLTVL